MSPMPSTTLTTKGQMTLPVEIRNRLRLKPGDRFDVMVDETRIILTPKTGHLEDLIGILPRPKKRLSIQEMHDVIEAEARERDRP